MILVEMAFSGAGGLESLVEETAQSLERRLEGLDLAWQDAYPVTLRESLRLGLQQQIVGGHACPAGPQDPKAPVYRVWIALPDGGLRAWTDSLVQRVLDGCDAAELPASSEARKQLQSALVRSVGPSLQRAESPEHLAGFSGR